MIKLERIDHFVMRVADVGATCSFYEKVLGMEVITFNGKDGVVRKALRFGQQVHGWAAAYPAVLKPNSPLPPNTPSPPPIACHHLLSENHLNSTSSQWELLIYTV